MTGFENIKLLFLIISINILRNDFDELDIFFYEINQSNQSNSAMLLNHEHHIYEYPHEKVAQCEFDVR